MMKTRISALMDGELEVHEAPSVFEQIAASESLRRDWRNYGLIRDAIRGEANLDVDLSERIMTALLDEPTVLAPVRAPGRSGSGIGRRMMAMAAGVAGVGVVGWLAMSVPGPVPLPTQQAPVAAATPRAAIQPVAAQESNRRMREYLVAHQTYAPAGQMQGGTRYIRTVAAER
jgi:sigma-E factor negative regulatory protein RseA